MHGKCSGETVHTVQYGIDKVLQATYEHIPHKIAPLIGVYGHHMCLHQTTNTLLCYTKCSLDGERGEMLSSSLNAIGGTSVVMLLPPPSIALSLTIEKQREKMREEVKEVPSS